MSNNYHEAYECDGNGHEWHNAMDRNETENNENSNNSRNKTLKATKK